MSKPEKIIAPEVMTVGKLLDFLQKHPRELLIALQSSEWGDHFKIQIFERECAHCPSLYLVISRQ